MLHALLKFGETWKWWQDTRKRKAHGSLLKRTGVAQRMIRSVRVHKNTDAVDVAKEASMRKFAGNDTDIVG